MLWTIDETQPGFWPAKLIELPVKYDYLYHIAVDYCRIVKYYIIKIYVSSFVNDD